MVQAHIFVSGFVQGVGFRRFLRHEAKKLKLTGWVRNTRERQVEAVIQGEKEVVEKLIARARRGSFLSEVQEVVVEWEEVIDVLTEFVIKW